MTEKTSAKSSSSRRSIGKVSKTPPKHNLKQKTKWKVVGGKIELSPGDYTIEDIEAMLKAIQRVSDGRVPRKDNIVK